MSEVIVSFNDFAASINAPVFSEVIGNQVPLNFKYINSKGESDLYIFTDDDKIMNLLQTRGPEEGFLIERTLTLSHEEVSNSILTEGIAKLFGLSSSDFEGQAVSQISAKLGNGFSVSRANNIISIEELIEVQPSDNTTGVSLVSSRCFERGYAKIYLGFLGIDVDDLPVGALINALSNSVPDDEPCFSPVACRVQIELNKDESISQEMMDQINIDYLREVFGIPSGYPLESLSSETLLNWVSEECLGSEGENTNDGYILNGNNITDLCANFFVLTQTFDINTGLQNGNQTGVSGLNFEFTYPDGSTQVHSSSEVSLWMGASCNDPNIDYSNQFAQAVQQAYSVVQSQILTGLVPSQEISVSEAIQIAMDNYLTSFYANCVPTNNSDADANTYVVLKDNENGVLSNSEFTPINEQNILQLCP